MTQYQNYKTNFEILNQHYNIRLHHNFSKTGMWKKIRQEILIRDNFTCKKCNITYQELKEQNIIMDDKFVRDFGIGILQVDHIKPIKDKGGIFDYENLQTLCYKCHKEKTDSEKSSKKNINKTLLIADIKIKKSKKSLENKCFKFIIISNIKCLCSCCNKKFKDINLVSQHISAKHQLALLFGT